MSNLRNGTTPISNPTTPTTSTTASNTNNSILSAFEAIVIVAIAVIGMSVINHSVPLVGTIFLLLDSYLRSRCGVNAEIVDFKEHNTQLYDDNFDSREQEDHDYCDHNNTQLSKEDSNLFIIEICSVIYEE